MKAVILAAGYGSRLGIFTKHIPKALLFVGNKPIIAHTLKILKTHGIRDIVVVTGYKGYKLRKYLIRNFDLNFDFVHNRFYRKTNNVYSLYLAMEKVDEDFYIINSDVFSHPKIFEFLHKSDKDYLILSVDTVKRLGEEEMKVRIENDRIVEISKKIPPENADGEYIGFARVPKKNVGDLYEHLETVMREKGRNVFYEEAFQSMIDSGIKLSYESTRGLPWIEIDTPYDLMIARREVFRRIKCSN